MHHFISKKELKGYAMNELLLINPHETATSFPAL